MTAPAAGAPAARDAILGVAPRLVVEPASVDEAAAAMRSFAGDRLAVAFVGGRTDIDLGAPPSRLDAVLRTGRLDRIREHAPSDQIVAVQGGMTIAALQRHLAEHGQRLAIDPPLAERVTAGGLLAANAFGPRRTRFGGARDLVIGITVIRADGVVARGGGKVVKNVAGFDLPRLFCGSLGTLGLVAEVVFRLHPLPETSVTVLVRGLDGADVWAVTKAVLDARLEPVAAAALWEGSRLDLALRFEGFAPGVRGQVERVSALLAARRPEALAAADEAALWARHDAIRTRGDLRVKATFPPAWLPRAVPLLAGVAGRLGAGGAVLYPTLGIGFATGAADEPAVGAEVAAARAALVREGGSLVLAAAPAALRDAIGVWGPPPGGVEVMRRLKAELDPDGRLAPGRFTGGI